MKCNICDSTLKGEDVIWSALYEEWEPCPTCLIAINEVFEDQLDEEQVTYLLEEEGILDPIDEEKILLDNSP